MKPYFFISPYNSIRFAECVDWNPYNQPKTPVNTLSYNEDGINTKDFYQLFQLNDAVRTQFKSNYSNHTITINGCDGSVQNITLTKRTDYAGEHGFDVYEFDIDFYLFEEGKYQIEIKATDNDFEDVVYLSERLFVKDQHENTHLFIFSHHKNTQINYSWGIQHMMRLEYAVLPKYSPDGENNIHKTDNNTFLLSFQNYEHYEFELIPIPTGMASKISMSLSLRELFIDNRSYVINGTPAVEKLGDSNLYSYKFKLILSNTEYDNRNWEFSTMVNSENQYLKIGEGYLKNGNGFLIIN